MKKALSLEHLNEGEMLYHYTKIHPVQSIFETGVLYATKSSFLNDTNEMGYIMHVAGEVVAGLQNERFRELLTHGIVETMEEMRRRDVFVLSFSLLPDSITLWSEFGEQTGYNMAFDGKELLSCIEARDQDIYCHGRVLYDHALQIERIKDLFYNIIPRKVGLPFEEVMTRGSRDPGDPDFRLYGTKLHHALNVYALFFKQEEFSPEMEYRIVFRTGADKSRVHFREKDGFLLPYLEISVTGRDGKIPVKAITVAPKNHVDLARKGMLQYTQAMGYDVPVELSKLKLRY